MTNKNEIINNVSTGYFENEDVRKLVIYLLEDDIDADIDFVSWYKNQFTFQVGNIYIYLVPDYSTELVTMEKVYDFCWEDTEVQGVSVDGKYMSLEDFLETI